MPEKRTLQRARKDQREGKSASTQAGEFVREEMDHAREGKHPVTSRKQAIAIGLSKARRAGVKLKPPKKSASAATKRKAASDQKHARRAKKTNPRQASGRRKTSK